MAGLQAVASQGDAGTCGGLMLLGKSPKRSRPRIPEGSVSYTDRASMGGGGGECIQKRMNVHIRA